jgi:glycosyltransferase involved in cell wall biosynthesis
VRTGIPPEETGTTSALRVALLTNFVPPYRTPLFRLLARRFDAFRVFVSTRMEPNRDWDPQTEGLDVEVLRGFTVNRTERHPHEFSNSAFVHLPYSVLFRLRHMRPDVVVSGQLGFASLLAALYRMLQRETARVLWLTLSEVSELGRGWFRRAIRRWLLSRAEAVMVNGESGARYARSLGTAEEKIFRIYQAVDNDAFSTVRERPRGAGRRLLFVGSTECRKGLAPFLGHLMQWAANHSSQSVELRVAGLGEPPIRDDRDLPVNMIVRWLGSVPYEQMPSIYADASILVFPTLADEWGLVVNEALAAGVPVLGSRYSQAVEELVEEGVTGWSFHPDREDECQAILERALDVSEEDLDRMRSACLQRIAAFTFETTADRMFEAIAFAASRRKT